MSNPKPPPNRRGGMRRAPKGGAKVVCRKGALGLGPNLAIRLLDVSEGGARLLLKEMLPEGQDVEVVLNPPGGAREVKCKGVVAWAVSTAEGECCIGVRFEKYLAYSILGDLARNS